MWRSLAVLIASSLAGCATYSWQHPYKGASELGVDQYNCMQQAANTFPVVMGQAYRDAYTTPARTTCRTSKSKDQREEITDCTTMPSVYYPPQPYTVDLNKSKRDNASHACLNSLGWAWQKDPR